jgi:hypothetical protein
MWLAAALLLAVAACAKHHPTAPAAVVDSGPVANSPANAVRRLTWALLHRDTTTYAGVLTDDFVFVFAPSDSAGNPWRDQPWDRACELPSIAHLLLGGGALPRASHLALAIDSMLFASPDPRPGHGNRWHRSVRTHIDLKLTVTDAGGTPSVTPVSGYALFFAVRGDSAVLSPERIAAGDCDSTRWYLERWEDQTVGTATPGLHPEATQQGTLGRIKVLYR